MRVPLFCSVPIGEAHSLISTSIGQWPIAVGRKVTTLPVYLSEETHFDVVLGRSFMERRGVKIDPTDLTNVVCTDVDEKLDVEVVIIRDGKGEIVTVT